MLNTVSHSQPFFRITSPTLIMENTKNSTTPINAPTVCTSTRRIVSI